MNNYDYPEGVDTKDAPWNQPDAVKRPFLVELRIRVTALDDEDAFEQAKEILAKAGVRWADYDLEDAYEEP